MATSMIASNSMPTFSGIKSKVNNAMVCLASISAGLSPGKNFSNPNQMYIMPMLIPSILPFWDKRTIYYSFLYCFYFLS
jgi:hypothetical protein